VTDPTRCPCGSVEGEVWGESGVFWWHCHACGRDGPDIEETIRENYEAVMGPLTAGRDALARADAVLERLEKKYGDQDR